MTNNPSWTKRFFSGIWSALNFTRNLFFNLIFIVIFIAIASALMAEDEGVKVPNEAALVLQINGDIVIEKHAIDPLDKFLQEAFEQKDEQPEVLLRDILLTLENAQQDQRIQAIVLDLHGMRKSGLDKLQQIGAAIDGFKESGKPVYAIGDYFTQDQYYLASHADHIYLNPMGGIFLNGYGRYRLYFKEALAKLKATTHIFRVGTYKSAIEPYIRDDMSEDAKIANSAWLNKLWQQYKNDVATARNISMDNFDENLDQFSEKFAATNGDFASYALENNWVDALKNREDIRQELAELVGASRHGKGYNNIGFEDYLSIVKSPYSVGLPGYDQVGIVVAKGTILDGTRKPGNIGGDSTAKLLRQAREDDNIKAVVLQVDTPGGSAFASEIIRQEVDLIKAAGKPLVVSMSTHAASGGYWISATADEIWAAPSTITGSIGVFGMFMTYENTLDYLGVHADGVGTTDFSGLGVTRALDPRVSNIMQMGVEQSYNRFLELVAGARDMNKSNVDDIAQGRVWIGETAKELGLVDKLGYLDDAVKSAADLAGLEHYDTHYVEPPLSAREQFWQQAFSVASQLFAKAHIAKGDTELTRLVKHLVSNFDAIAQLNDPRGVYAFCIECEAN